MNTHSHSRNVAMPQLSFALRLAQDVAHGLLAWALRHLRSALAFT